VKRSEIFHAWGRILAGRAPSMSIEITKECPLRCPGCYAYEDAHLGGLTTLRQLSDHKGDDLVARVLALVDRERPLHLSLVGGDPLVRFRELDQLLPQLNARRIFVQVVTSAFRPIPLEWRAYDRMNVVVSVDGLPAEHDVRRAPATIARILKNIAGHEVIVHSTVTGQIMRRPGYLREFLEFWSPRPELRKMWISLFTPQRGAAPAPEQLTPDERARAIEELLALRREFPKLDMAAALIREFAAPPPTPRDCVFAKTTAIYSADLRTRVMPCQFGGDPDCTQCGCIASMGLAAVGNHKLAGVFPVRHLFNASLALGRAASALRPSSKPPRESVRPAPAADTA
jgi:organic radical activating enzyme